MKVLITGGSGFLGKSLIEKLKDKDIEILALSRNDCSEYKNKNVKWIMSDFSKVGSFFGEIEKFKPDIIFHFYWEEIPHFTFNNCYKSLKRSITFFNKVFNLKTVKKIIVSGTCLEYETKTGLCEENSNQIVSSNNYFTWSKSTLRQWLEIEVKKRSIEFFWFRIFYVYGPNQRKNSLIPYILNCFMKKKLPKIQNFYNANDYIYIDDVTKVFLRILKFKVPSGIYNLGMGQSTKVIDICSIAEKIVNKTQYFNKQKENFYVNQIHKDNLNFWSDMTKTKKFFKFTNFLTLEKGIKRTYNALKNEN